MQINVESWHFVLLLWFKCKSATHLVILSTSMNAFQGRLRSLLFEKLLFPYESRISVIISRRRFMRSEGATVFCIKMCVCIWIIKQDEMRIKCFFCQSNSCCRILYLSKNKWPQMEHLLLSHEIYISHFKEKNEYKFNF